MFLEALVDNSTLEGHIFEAIVQIIVWSFIILYVEKLVAQYCEGYEWFKHVGEHPGGTREFLATAGYLPQHFTAGLLVLIGCLLNNTRIVRHGLLTEFGFETYDLVRIWTLHFRGLMNDKDGQQTVAALTFHHCSGILAIIPGSLYLADNIYFQKVAITLLLPSAVFLFLGTLMKTYNVNDLAERTKFTACYVLSLVVWSIARLQYFNMYAYLLIYNYYHLWSNFLQTVVIGYFAGLSVFNVLVTYFAMARFQTYMVSHSENKKHL